MIAQYIHMDLINRKKNLSKFGGVIVKRRLK